MARRVRLEDLDTEALLDTRMCDLGVQIEGSWLEPLLERVQGELEHRRLQLRPQFWLSDEWFSPNNVPGVAMPFYLAHPRLMRLERKMMFEIEGGSRHGCLKLLRHELGHAIQHGYAVHRKKRWREIFGRATEPYPSYYRPRPSSKRFVQHLDGWYAQSHPAEDFAETFAVWLSRSRARWRSEYAGWPALEKLEYVNSLMDGLADVRPPNLTRQKPYSLPTLRYTLRTHYARRTSHYATGWSDQYDRDLVRLFSNEPEHKDRLGAAVFIRRNRKAIRERVSTWTGEYQFVLDQVLKEMIGRSKELRLRLRTDEETTRTDFAILLTVHTVHTLHRGNEWHPL
jgi:hypothetical protein